MTDLKSFDVYVNRHDNSAELIRTYLTDDAYDACWCASRVTGYGMSSLSAKLSDEQPIPE